MSSFESTHDVIVRQERALNAWRQPAHNVLPLPDTSARGGDTRFAGRGLVFTAAQDLGFFARSKSWQCAACLRVHRFDEKVSVVTASPCVCAGIEFEPHADGTFATPMLTNAAVPLLDVDTAPEPG